METNQQIQHCLAALAAAEPTSGQLITTFLTEQIEALSLDPLQRIRVMDGIADALADMTDSCKEETIKFAMQQYPEATADHKEFLHKGGKYILVEKRTYDFSDTYDAADPDYQAWRDAKREQDAAKKAASVALKQMNALKEHILLNHPRSQPHSISLTLSVKRPEPGAPGGAKN